MSDTASNDVADVTIERTESMTVTFDDGLVCRFGVGELRAACPCATCRGFRERGGVAWPRVGQSESIEITDASFSGAWGISITWSDGHDTGIYAWANLRRWWTTGFHHAIEDTE
ncbi:MAG: hypothetical protein JWN62_3696 [Acidimicrobiales bacterium]|nr:hypothetical protein [Acidimicrobiales bacterium]